jgi:hypothetical protein
MISPTDTKRPCRTCSQFGNGTPVKVGNHPRSAYCSTELRGDIKNANRVAPVMGCRSGSDLCVSGNPIISS